VGIVLFIAFLHFVKFMSIYEVWSVRR
jgi:hypothetical protein